MDNELVKKKCSFCDHIAVCKLTIKKDQTIECVEGMQSEQYFCWKHAQDARLTDTEYLLDSNSMPMEDSDNEEETLEKVDELFSKLTDEPNFQQFASIFKR